MFRCLILSGMLAFAVPLRAQDAWRHYTDIRDITVLSARGDHLWLGTGSNGKGSVLRLDRNTGETTSFAAEMIGSDKRVTDVAAGADGTAWITSSGLFQYDNSQWTKRSDGYSSRITTDDGGVLWAVTSSMTGQMTFRTVLSSYDGKEWQTRIEDNNYYSNSGEFSLVAARDGNVWTYGWPDLYRHNSLTSKTLAIIVPSTMAYYLSSMAPDRNGGVWFGSPEGVFYRDTSGKWTRHSTETGGLASNSVSAVLVDSLNMLWAGTDAGLQRFDGTEWKSYFSGDESPGKIGTLAVDGGNTVWAATREDLFRAEDDQLRKVSDLLPRLPGNQVTAAAVDRDNVKWFGLSNRGVSSFDGRAWKHYGMEEGLPDSTVRDIAVDENNTKWFLTPRGVCRFDGKTWRTFSKGTGDFHEDNPYAFALSPNGSLWVGWGSGAVMRYDGASWIRIPDCGETIRKMKVDQGGALWVATYYSSKLWRFDGVSWQKFDLYSPISALLVDHTNTVWAGTRFGLVRPWRNGKWEDFLPSPEFLNGREITSIAEDADGVLWFGINGGGAAAWKNGVWSVMARLTSGIGDDWVYSVAIDRDNNKWFGTYTGVSRYSGPSPEPWQPFIRVTSPKEGDRWSVGTVHDIEWTPFTVENVRIEYSPDGGSTWELIVENVPASPGKYTWFTPATPSESFLVRVSDMEQPDIFGVSEEFSVYAPVMVTSEGTWRFHPYPQPNFNVTGIAAKRDGSFWCSANDTLYTITNGAWLAHPPEETGIIGAVRPMVEDSEGNWWFGGREITRFNGTEWKQYRFDSIFDGKQFVPFRGAKRIVADSEGAVWFLGGGNVACYRDGSQKLYRPVDIDPSSTQIEALAVDAGNRVWFGTRNMGHSTGNVVIFDGHSWTFFDDPEERIAGRAILWISSLSDGWTLFGFAPEWYLPLLFNGSRYQSLDGSIREAVEDREGALWLLMEDPSDGWLHYKGVLLYEPATGKGSWYLSDGGLFHNLRQVCVGYDNRKWFISDQGFWSFEDRKDTPVEDASEVPLALSLSPNHPNPFNPDTMISFSLPQPGKVSLVVYDITGRRVRELASRPMEAGTHTVRWDGRDGSGNPASSGVYLTVLRAGGHTVTRKMALVK